MQVADYNYKFAASTVTIYVLILRWFTYTILQRGRNPVAVIDQSWLCTMENVHEASSLLRGRHISNARSVQ